MLRGMNKRLPALLTLLLSALPMLAADAGRILDGTAFVIEEAFVDAARGREIGAALRKQSVDAKLEGAALAEAITQAIWKIENDGHLNVRFDPATAGTPLVSRDELRTRLQDTGPRMVRRMPGSEAETSQVSSRMLDGGVGVLDIRLFTGEPAHFTEAIAKIEDARAVIVDLRGNRGGSQQLVNYVASYFFPADDRVLLTSRFRTPSPSRASTASSRRQRASSRTCP
jgi:retinol-binding protein 3